MGLSPMAPRHPTRATHPSDASKRPGWNTPSAKTTALRGLFVAENGDVEGRAASAAAVEPGLTTVHLGDLLDDGEPDSGAPSPILRRPETLECLEYLLVILGVDSASGIAHGDVTNISFLEYRNCDARLLASPHVIDRVSDQIREDLVEPGAVAKNERGVVRKL